VIAKLMSYRLG